MGIIRTRNPTPCSNYSWLDGYQQFVGAPYSPALCVVIDVRYVVPAAGSSAPAGWALLPVFERSGAYVASGAYHLPLFQVCLGAGCYWGSSHTDRQYTQSQTTFCTAGRARLHAAV